MKSSWDFINAKTCHLIETIIHSVKDCKKIIIEATKDVFQSLKDEITSIAMFKAMSLKFLVKRSRP